MTSQKAASNRLMYQASLMAELASGDHLAALKRAGDEASIFFLYQALCSAVLEVCEHYQVKVPAQKRGLTPILAVLGQSHPDCWEYKTLQEALANPNSWVSRLCLSVDSGYAVDSGSVGKTPSVNLIAVASGDDTPTNCYPNFYRELQQWIDDMRSLNDQH